MRGQLYYIDKDTIDKAVDKAVASFRQKYGYPPRTLVARQEDLYDLHVRTDIQVQAKSCIQRRHFILYEVIMGKRPRVLKVKRTPVL